jgi:hypothetical protein
MTSNIVFHIRRMVAEAFAAQKPEDEDWQLLRELRRKNRDVFQVIYTHAKSIDWHHFWFKYLVPVLREDQDAEGIAAHVHRVAQWASQDAAGVLTFWEEALFLPWIEHIYIARQVILHLTEFDLENAASTTSLIKKLLNAPDQEHSFLGRAIARCMSAGGGDDSMLWQFIAGNITDNDALAFKFGEKLRCGAHEFGGSGNEFLIQRMKQSTALLDMAVQSVEHWSQIRISTKGDWIAGSMGFLGDTSYEDVHSNKEIRHQDNDRLLFDAIEGAIFEQARMNSQWWITHCDRLAFSQEGALRYFAILACTAYPANNIALIERMLSDKALLESELSYEIGNLIKASFVSLISDAQDTITAEILNIHDDSVEEEHLRRWLLYKRARLIATIPCHMRSKETQIGLDSYERIEGPILNQPEIMSHGGMVIAPFSFEVFLNMADAGVLRLMRHYAGYSNKNGADFLIGGESEVGGQLREAASRQTTRFLCLLKAHWAEISDRFRDEIVRGISNYLFYRFGNLQADSNWKPLEEPIPDILAHDVLNELERHSSYWRHDRAAADALLACAHVIADIVDANRLVFLALGFCNFEEVRPIVGGKVDLINNGINMVNGHIAEAMIILAKRLRKANISYPELLHPMLRRFAGHKEPAFRALILRRLPYLQSLDPDLGWELFDLAVEGDATDLWEIAEPCLYYSYHCNFEIISPILARIRTEGKGKDLETWGRISTLAALTNRVKFTDLLEDLNSLNCEAWRGAAAVWTNHQNMKQYREQCLTGIKEGLNNANRECASLMATCLVHAFRPNDHLILMPTAFIRSFFEILEVKTENRNAGLIQFDEWLNAVSQRDTDLALGAAEIYLAYLSRTRAHVYDVNDSLPKLLTRLFAEAEEREESDNGEMLQRVVALQDTMLALGINGVNEWLAAAERP